MTPSIACERTSVEVHGGLVLGQSVSDQFTWPEPEPSLHVRMVSPLLMFTWILL